MTQQSWSRAWCASMPRLGLLGGRARHGGLITTYDTDSEVAAVARRSRRLRRSALRLGAVATGGGGMAPDGAGMAVPVLVGLVAITMLATAGIVLRRQEA